jgi:hypothetical protein
VDVGPPAVRPGKRVTALVAFAFTSWADVEWMLAAAPPWPRPAWTVKVRAWRQDWDHPADLPIDRLLVLLYGKLMADRTSEQRAELEALLAPPVDDDGHAVLPAVARWERMRGNRHASNEERTQARWEAAMAIREQRAREATP